MKSGVQTVDEYMDGLIPGRRGVLEHVRGICQSYLPQSEEGLWFRVPCYRIDGDMIVAFASQRQHIAFYIMDESIFERFKERMPAADCGKCCLRFRQPEELDLDTLKELLAEIAAA